MRAHKKYQNTNSRGKVLINFLFSCSEVGIIPAENSQLKRRKYDNFHNILLTYLCFRLSKTQGFSDGYRSSYPVQLSVQRHVVWGEFCSQQKILHNKNNAAKNFVVKKMQQKIVVVKSTQTIFGCIFFTTKKKTRQQKSRSIT